MELVALCNEGKNQIAELKTQTQIFELSYMHDALVIAEICWSLKAALTDVFYHAWLVTNKRDLFDDPANLEYLWKIVQILVNDFEYKNSTGIENEKAGQYTSPSDVNFKYASNNYIFCSVVPSLTSTLKLNIDFEDRGDVLSTIAKTA